ncbi:MAG: SDR family NAD(P)-dependent oxidoreductase [Anaerolineae bacterium]|nr:SDR family NAD(P)-dependent oxidoreductase [Anaerolineae bacterium]
MTSISKAVLITGCSSGIGRATAKHLTGHGWQVYATARRLESMADLTEAGCHLLPLDVTSEESMQAAVAEVEKKEGAIGVLINNAGYSQSGAIETVPMELIRRQFETNVFGLVRLTQLVLPGMRRQGWGKIINISSVGGKITLPGGGFYHATKHAVEALSDALRFEVGGFGINVVVIEPGLIVTEFGHTGAKVMEGLDDKNGAYATFNQTVSQLTPQFYESGPLIKFGGGPEAVAQVIEKAIIARRPKTRYLVTPSARMMLIARKLMTDRMWDAAMSQLGSRPGD